jgi:hypothetical protein
MPIAAQCRAVRRTSAAAWGISPAVGHISATA